MGHNTIATEGIDISLDKARTWIHSKNFTNSEPQRY